MNIPAGGSFNSMYRIGQFARLGDVSAKTLRFYDEIGLLRPAVTDPVTRYRYYTAEQLRDLAAIVMLKGLGLSLDEVREMRRKAPARALRRALLQRARSRLESTVSDARAALAGLDATLESDDTTPIVIKQRPAVHIASIGVYSSSYDEVALVEHELLGRTPAEYRGSVRGVLWHQCADMGTPAGEPFVEIRRAVRGVDVRELPAVTVACAYTADSEDAAEDGYRAIRGWMRARSYELAGPKREIYHGSMVEIQFPLA